MKPRSAFLLIITLALIGALSACTADGGSIYATIETEQKINVSTLSQTITVLDLVNTFSAPFRYLVAAGAVYKGRVPNTDNEIGWPKVGADPIAVSPPAEGALCLALTYFDNGVPAQTGVYGAFFTSDGSTMGLYKSVGALSYSFAVADGATAIADPLVAGKQICLLQVANNTLFAVVATPAGTSGFTFELDYSTDGSNFFATNLKNLTNPITGVGFFGGNYYVTSGPKLYSDSGAGLNSLTGSSTIGSFPISSGDELRGVTVDDTANYILIPSGNGAVYYYDGVTSWARARTGDNLNGRQVGFLTVSTRAGNVGLGKDIFLVGADGAGYYTLNTGNGNLSRFSDVTVTGLYAGAVRRILVDGSTVFMGAAGTGLWRATFDPAGEVNSTWIHE